MRTEMIDDYLVSLRRSLGHIRPKISDEQLRRLHRINDIRRIVEWVRDHLSVPVKIRIGFVNSGGEERVPAWIHKPALLPLYGTDQLRRTQVIVFLRKQFLSEAPFESCMLAVAHELTHVVLSSLRHPLENEEVAVDLAAMMLGYRDLYRKGVLYVVRGHSIESSWALGNLRDGFFRRVLKETLSRETHLIGYLSVSEVRYASDLMDRLARKQ